MYRFLNFVTCSKVPKFGRSDRREDPFVSIPTPLVDEDKQELHNQSVSEVEIIGHSKMGSGPGKTECQDTYTILSQLTPNLHSFAVYDGHGIKGKDVSMFVNQHMTSCLKKNSANIEKLVSKDYVESFFKTTFKVIESKLNHSSINTTHSGSCCLTIIISHGRCFVANLGDSRAVLCRQDLSGQLLAIDISQDHKPSREDEKKRILSSGGCVEPMYYGGTAIGPLRVWTKTKQGGIAVTRAMGDTRGRKAGLIAEPEVTKIDLESNDKFIIAASDGLWDVFTSQEAVAFVADYIARGRPRGHAARALIREASKRWEDMEENGDDPYRDDITVVIAFLDINARDTMIETPVKTPMN